MRSWTAALRASRSAVQRYAWGVCLLLALRPGPGRAQGPAAPTRRFTIVLLSAPAVEPPPAGESVPARPAPRPLTRPRLTLKRPRFDVPVGVAPGVASGVAASTDPLSDSAQPFIEGLRRFQRWQFREALPLLARAHALRPDALDLTLLLGICHYRLDEPEPAVPLLRAASRSTDEEVRSAAQLFLARIHQAAGALDQARDELSRAAALSRGPSSGMSGLLREPQTKRLLVSLLVSPEYDGNVALTDYNTWSKDRGSSEDGDLLLAGSLSVRPLRRVGLIFGAALSYRQQFRLQTFNLLLSSIFLGYSYLGADDRARVSAAFNYAVLGGASLFADVTGRAWYRRRLWRKLGVVGSYEGRYRGYQPTDFAPFTGHTHTLSAELSLNTAPDPVMVSLGFQAAREQLAGSVTTTTGTGTQAVTTTTPDFSAWAYGPVLRARARLLRQERHPIEIGLSGSAWQRRYDSTTAGAGATRVDWWLTTDLSLTVEAAPWLDVFVGGGAIYNQSTDPLYTFVKPMVYLGLGSTFSAF